MGVGGQRIYDSMTVLARGGGQAMIVDDNRGEGGALKKNQNQYDVIYRQPLTMIGSLI